MSRWGEAWETGRDFFLRDQGVRTRLERICLIWDLRGRLRLLLRPSDQGGLDIGDLKQAVDGALASLYPFYQPGEIWWWTKGASPSERAVYEHAWREAERVDAGPPELRILERHVSKELWFAAPEKEPWPLGEDNPPILSFYSFKGGVGRTTALLSLAIQVAREGKRVVVVDLDLEAPGLLSALPPPEGQEVQGGVVDFLLEEALVSDPKQSMDVGEYCYQIDDPRVLKDGPPLTVVPAGRLDGSYLGKLSRIDYQHLYRPGAQRRQAPLLTLLKRLRDELRAEYLLLDNRAGFHDLGGLALAGVGHLDVLFGLEGAQSWAGMEVVASFLGRRRLLRQAAQAPCAMVFAMAPPSGEVRDVAFASFKEHAYDLFAREYYDPEDSQGQWPLPDLDAPEQPHYPIVLGFDPLLQAYSRVADVVDRLTTGDYATFAAQVLAKVGRKLS